MAAEVISRDRQEIASLVLTQFNKFELTIAEAREALNQLGYPPKRIDALLLEIMRFRP